MKKLFTIKNLRVLFFSVILGIGLSGCTAPEGSPEDGQRWYMMHNCFACHGTSGSNGKGPVIYPLDMSFRSFMSTVRNANSPIMPKFPEEKIEKQDVADMYAWLKSK